MKVSIISESPADEEAIALLVRAVLRKPVESIPRRDRPGGWNRAMAMAESELRRLHYNTDADGLIVVVDSDDTPVHDEFHLQQPVAGCRVCALLDSFARVRLSLRPRAVGFPVRVAIGLPVPAIEAWLLCGTDPHISEDHFMRELNAGRGLANSRRALKRTLYGREDAPRSMEREKLIAHALRVTAAIELLRTQFPRGFGLFYEQLAAWR